MEVELTVGLSMDVLQRRKGIKDLFGRIPVERSHGEMVIGPFTNGQLFLEVLERIEAM